MGKIIIDNINIPYLNENRLLRIYLPDGYDTDINKYYPVIYMHDAQNLFDVDNSASGISWNADKSLDSLIKNNISQPMIIIGIDNVGNTNRFSEYSPWINSNIKKYMTYLNLLKLGGDGVHYKDFFEYTLIPYINDKYRVKKERRNTYIGGSSMGGLISLYIGLALKHKFSKIISMSTAVWFAKKELFNFIKESSPINDIKIYMDIGTNETSDRSIEKFPYIYLNDSKELYHLLLNSGLNEKDLIFIIEDKAVHCETSWSRRLPAAFEWILGHL